ncbi:G-protein coupled receptor F59B2.13 [Biomphalaria glabrata]|nr:G-protein coupled receptor F59B2.13 [Biomphalaria glabrata]
MLNATLLDMGVGETEDSTLTSLLIDESTPKRYNFSRQNRNDDTTDESIGTLQDFHIFFLEIHGYASLVVCAFGILTNVLNITVLMAKDMRTATNHLLTFLAIADILTMLPYIPFVLHFYCPPADPYDSPEKFSYSWIVYMIIIISLLATTHTIAIWLAVTLAAFRFSQIRSPCPRGPMAKEMRVRQVKIAAAVVYITSVVVMIPNYLSHEIIKLPMPRHINVSAFGLKEMHYGTKDIDLIILTNILTYAILAKILPCILILVFSGSLLYHMGIKAARRRQRLSVSCQQVQTTRMLLVVLLMFIITELPQGVLNVLSALVPDFYLNFHYPLTDLMDFVALVNNAINFVLYCVMSQQFREKFFSIYIKPICERRRTMITSNSELLILREHPPRTMTTTTHEETLRV